MISYRVIRKTYQGKTRKNLMLACDEFGIPCSQRMLHLMMIDLFVWGMHTVNGTQFCVNSGTDTFTVRAGEMKQ